MGRRVDSIRIAFAMAIVGCVRREAPNPDAGSAATSLAPPAVAAAWSVSDSGVGPLRIGMRFVDGTAAVHGAVPDTSKLDPACDYATLDSVPAPVRLMWVGGALARIDVVEMGIVTTRGIGVGSMVRDVERAYRGAVTRMPHKYDDRGQYLIVGRDATPFKLVFETDSASKVTRYRVGREPEVEWVEGCS